MALRFVLLIMGVVAVVVVAPRRFTRFVFTRIMRSSVSRNGTVHFCILFLRADYLLLHFRV